MDKTDEFYEASTLVEQINVLLDYLEEGIYFKAEELLQDVGHDLPDSYEKPIDSALIQIIIHFNENGLNKSIIHWALDNAEGPGYVLGSIVWDHYNWVSTDCLLYLLKANFLDEDDQERVYSLSRQINDPKFTCELIEYGMIEYLIRIKDDLIRFKTGAFNAHWLIQIYNCLKRSPELLVQFLQAIPLDQWEQEVQEELKKENIGIKVFDSLYRKQLYNQISNIDWPVWVIEKREHEINQAEELKDQIINELYHLKSYKQFSKLK